MRQLTEQENRNRLADMVRDTPDIQVKILNNFHFRNGFQAGLDYQQRKLDAYAAYVAGKITQKELEEVVNA